MIGLATGHRVINYGTKLQAYAMQQIMKQRGFDYEILQFNNTGTSPFRKIILRIYHVLLDNVLKERKLKQQCLKRYSKVNSNILESVFSRSKAVNSFDKYLKIKRFYGDFNDLSIYCRKYSAIFCGSDQAWLPANIRHSFYTLDFAPEGVRRIAYAPSFGVNQLPDVMLERYRSFLSQLDYISVRENSGAELVKQLVHKDVPVVLDPTLLVGCKVWDKIIDASTAEAEGRYVLCYLLGDNPTHREYCEKVASLLNAKLLSFPHFIQYQKCDEAMGGTHLYEVNPCQFLGLIKQAVFVITDSFHCSAFSMQYHTPFAVLQRFRSNGATSTNSRIYSLLQTFALEERLIAPEATNALDIVKEIIDFEKCDRILEAKQIESNQYLDNAMKGLR